MYSVPRLGRQDGEGIMKQKNKVRRLGGRQAEYDLMLDNADSVEREFLSKSHIRPGSMKK